MSIESMTLARPYAKAAFEVALQNNELESWNIFLATLAWVVEQREVENLITHPLVTDEDLYELVEGVVQGVLTEERKNFLRLMIENKRLNYISAVQELFLAYKEAHENKVEVHVRASMPLSEEQLKKLDLALSQKLNKKILITTEIDASLIGGAIIKIGDLTIDGSLKNTLATLKDKLIQTSMY